MELKWNLDKLYTSFESKKLKEDKIKLKNLLDKNILELQQRENKIDVSYLENFIENNIEILKTFEKLFAFGQLSFSTNVKNEKALELIEYCENLLTKEKEVEVIFKEALKECSNLDSYIEDSKILKEHEFYLKEEKKYAERLLSKKEEILIEQMKNNGSRAWEKLQDTLTSTLEVKYTSPNGEEKILTLSEVRNMAYSEDKEIRKRAYYAELKAYKNIELSIGTALNNIKAQSIRESQMRGFKNVLQKTLEESRMEKNTLSVMLEVIKESLPKFTAYFKRKAELLGYENLLPFYELFAPIGKSNMNFTEKEAKAFILDNFYSFSANLGDMAKKAFEEKWIDFKPKDGKVGGAFCYNLNSIGENRILTNFTGSLNDVLTLAHELGHGYHGDQLKKESIINSGYPMTIAETASIFCETIVKNTAFEKGNDQEKITILEQDISDSMQVIVDIYSRFLFENKVITEREKKSISIEKLKEYMKESQKEAYLDGLDHELLHEYMWLCKGHYYSADLNFYNYPYAFGLLFAKGLYAKYLKNPDKFVKKYDELLSLTGKNKVEDIAAFMDINLSQKDFWINSINLIIKDIDRFLVLTK